MLRRLFVKTLGDRRRSLAWWGASMALMGVAMVAMYPSIRGMPNLDEFLKNYPEAMRKFFALRDISSGPGYLTTYVGSMFAPLMFAIFTITFAGNVVTGEEEHKTIDLLLALPVSRVQVLAGKYIAMLAATAGLGVVLFLSLWAGAPLVAMRISTAALVAGTTSVVLLGIAFGSIAFAVGCVTGRRGLTLGVGAGLAVAGYMLYSLSNVVSSLVRFRVLSLFQQAIGNEPLRNGLSLAGGAALLAISLGLLVAGLWVFQRRDLAT